MEEICIKLRSGYQVHYEGDSFKFIDHLASAIIGESTMPIGLDPDLQWLEKMHFKKSGDEIGRAIAEEVKYVVKQFDDIEIAEAFMTDLLAFIVNEKWSKIVKSIKRKK